jgi:hypothetical protein
MSDRYQNEISQAPYKHATIFEDEEKSLMPIGKE